MFKWIKLIRFIRKHRKNGMASFTIATTSDEIIIVTEGICDYHKDYKHEQLRLKY